MIETNATDVDPSIAAARPAPPSVEGRHAAAHERVAGIPTGVDESGNLALAVDLSPRPTILVAVCGTIAFLNEAAREFMRRPGCVLAVADRRLVVRDSKGSSIMSARIAQGAREPGVTVVRLRNENFDVAVLLTALSEDRVAIVVSDLNTPLCFDAVVARAQFGLSRAEAEILAGLASGLDVVSIAAARGVARGTVRTQVKAMLAKLGVRSQGHAVALAVASLATLRPVQPRTDPGKEPASAVPVTGWTLPKLHDGQLQDGQRHDDAMHET